MDTAILDNVLNILATACTGNGSIQGYATSLFGLLIAIDFVLCVLMNLLSFGGGQSFISMTAMKLLGYGFWLWVIQNWGTFCNNVIDSLSIAGASLGSGSADLLKHPSEIFGLGMDLVDPVFTWITEGAQLSWSTIISSIGLYLTALVACTAILVAFGLMAFQAFITYVEFYIAGALMLLFIPFATTKYTERFAQNCIGGVIATGVKLMFMGAILSMAMNSLNALEMSFTGTPSWDKLVTAAFIPWALAYLCCEAPSMAAGFMSGGPALSSGSMLGHALGAAGMAAGSVALGSGIAGKALGGAGSAVKSAASVAGAYSQGGLGGVMKSAVQASASGVGDSYRNGQDKANAGVGNYHPRMYHNYGTDSNSKES